MKVLQINAVSGMRSTGRICVEIADYLNENGNKGYIAYSSGLPYKQGYKIGTPLEIKLHGLYSRIFGKQAYYSKSGTMRLIDYINEIKPDIVHLHNLHANYINLNILLYYIAINNIPTVLTLHDCWFYTGKCTHYTLDGCNKWQTGCGNCVRLKKDNPSWFFDKTRAIYNDKKELFMKIPRLAIVGVSDWITDEARLSILSSAKEITRIYNWIDIDIFKPISSETKRQVLGLQDRFIILGVASDWSNAKGLSKFIELADQIQEDMDIVLIGNIRSDINLPNKIIHINETYDVNELVEYYSMADVLLNLSAEESFGKVTAEALSCGTPAVVINSTANPELIGNGCGFIIENDKIDNIINAIEEIYKNGKKIYTDSCRDFVKANFEKKKRIADYVNLYKKISK